jgi:hypothetical protein
VVDIRYGSSITVHHRKTQAKGQQVNRTRASGGIEMAVNQEAAAMSTGIQALSLANHVEDEKEDNEEEVCDAAAMSTGLQEARMSCYVWIEAVAF